MARFLEVGLDTPYVITSVDTKQLKELNPLRDNENDLIQLVNDRIKKEEKVIVHELFKEEYRIHPADKNTGAVIIYETEDGNVGIKVRGDTPDNPDESPDIQRIELNPNDPGRRYFADGTCTVARILKKEVPTSAFDELGEPIWIKIPAMTIFSHTSSLILVYEAPSPSGTTKGSPAAPVAVR